MHTKNEKINMHLILVPLLVEGARGRRVTASRNLAGVLPHLSKPVHLADRAQHLLRLRLVLILPTPGLQNRRLQSAGEGEGHVPGRVRHVLGHGLDVLRRLPPTARQTGT